MASYHRLIIYAALSWLLCYACSFMGTFFWLYGYDWIQYQFFILAMYSYPILEVMCVHDFPVCTVMAQLSWIFCHDCSTLAIHSKLYCHGCPILTLPLLSCSSCDVLAVSLGIDLRLYSSSPVTKYYNYIAVVFNQKTIVNPVWCMNVLLGREKPSWSRLCVKVDHPNPSPSITWMVNGENHPLPPH
jgi:hypothetical protein